MDFESGMYMAEEGIAEMIGVLVSLLGSNVLSFALGIAAYVLSSLGLYTIAQRRGIRNPWMAWVPVLSVWILGSIADQYRYVARGEVRSRRKVLITMAVLQVVAWIAVVVLLIVMVVSIVMQAPNFDSMGQKELMNVMLKSLLPVGGALMVMGIISLIAAVFRYIAYADLFASCDPDNKVLFLVLGILFSVTLPFFVFACRKKDLGMPPRRVQQPISPEPPVEAPPVYQEPEEPWVNSEE